LADWFFKASTPIKSPVQSARQNCVHGTYFQQAGLCIASGKKAM
jgi:hypothetical protein